MRNAQVEIGCVSLRYFFLVVGLGAMTTLTACPSTSPGNVEAVGYITFKAHSEANRVNVADCEVDFYTDDLRGNYEFSIRCGEVGWVSWYWSSQRSFDAMVAEGEISEFNNIEGGTIKCAENIAGCVAEQVYCAGPPFEDPNGSSTLNRYAVDSDDIVEHGSTFTAHGLFEFDMPECMEGDVEFKINVR